MPILCEANQRKRRVSVKGLLAVPGVVVLILVGVIAWTWVSPTTFNFGHASLFMGFRQDGPRGWGGLTIMNRYQGMYVIEIPDSLGGGVYGVTWSSY